MVFRKFIEKHVNEEYLRFLGLFMVILGFCSLMGTFFIYAQMDSVLSSTQQYSDALDAINTDVGVAIDRFGDSVSSINDSMGDFETSIVTMSTKLSSVGSDLKTEGESLQGYVGGSSVTNQMFLSLGASLVKSGSSIKDAASGFDNLSYSFSSNDSKFDSFSESLDSIKVSLTSAKDEVVSSMENLRVLSLVVLVLGTMFSLVFLVNGIAYGLIYLSLKRFHMQLKEGPVVQSNVEEKVKKPVSGSSTFVKSSKK